MGWFNYYGLIFMIAIMIPNIFYAIKHKESGGFYHHKAIEITEQIGRYGTMAFMVFNVPYTYFNFWFQYARIVYLVVNGFLILIYCLMWLVLWKKNDLMKALILSVIPTVVFLFSGAMLANVPLLLSAILFGYAHILISCKNSIIKESHQKI